MRLTAFLLQLMASIEQGFLFMPRKGGPTLAMQFAQDFVDV